MGYVTDTRSTRFISPFNCAKTAGTWTPTLGSNTVADVRTANDSAFTIFIPVLIPSNEVALKGARLKSIDVFYKIGTAAADDFATVELEKMTLPASGVAVTVAAVTTTLDAAHDTAAERKATGDHTLTITLSTPVWVDDGEAYWLQLVVDAAATTVFTLFGAVAHFDYRV
jgi:hypothetical protein